MASRGFWRELKRRHVYRVAAAYAIVGWLLIQVVTQVFPVFHLPDWVDQAIVLLILVGFPIALVLAWAFDATPQGIVLTDAQDSEDMRASRRSHRAGIVVGLIGALIALVAGGEWWHVERNRLAESAVHDKPSAVSVAMPTAASTAAGVAAAKPRVKPASPIAAQSIPAQSIAVLPLANESGEKDQQYFSDGLSEDLINALSQFAGLKVISRNSSFQFRDSKQPSVAIGQALGVAHLLEGSVQRLGDEVRITAQLVNATDGSTLWSQHYDRLYKDLFTLQDDITREVAGALKARLLASGKAVAQGERPPSGSLVAWNAYSRGRFHAVLIDPADAHEAIDFFQQAIALDPQYARAYASLAYAWATLGGTFLSGEEQRQAFIKGRAAAERALQLDPDMAMAHVSRAVLLLWADLDWTGAEAEYRRAVELAPNDSLPQFGLGLVFGTLGNPQQGIPLIRRSIATDPRSGAGWYWLAWNLAATGQLDQAELAARKAIEVMPGKPFLPAGLALIEVQRGEREAALATAQREPPGTWRDIALTFALQVGNDRVAADAALKNLIAKSADGSAYQIAEVYGLRKDPDEMFTWLERAWETRDPGLQRLLTDPFILRYKDDPRFAAFCKKVGLPTTTEAKALP